jgi:hypothetical protein
VWCGIALQGCCDHCNGGAQCVRCSCVVSVRPWPVNAWGLLCEQFWNKASDLPDCVKPSVDGLEGVF